MQSAIFELMRSFNSHLVTRDSCDPFKGCDHDLMEFVKTKFQQKENQQVCLLTDKYSYMSNDLLSIIGDHYKVKMWPSFSIGHHDTSKRKTAKSIKYYNKTYKRLVKSKIECSKVVIAFVTRSFCQSEESMQLLEHAKQLKKHVIGLIVEEIETPIEGLSYYCELYKDRLNTSGYENLLWISNSFMEMIKKLEEFLKTHFVVGEKQKLKCVNFFDPITTKDHYEAILDTAGNFQKISNVVVFCEANEEYYGEYVDISQLNLTKSLDSKYTHDPRYDYIDSVMTINGIDNKNDYLKLIQHFDRLSMIKLSQFESVYDKKKYGEPSDSEEESEDDEVESAPISKSSDSENDSFSVCVPNKEKKKRMQKYYFLERIRQNMFMRFYPLAEEELESDKESSDESDDDDDDDEEFNKIFFNQPNGNYVLNATARYVRKELAKLNVSMKFMNSVLEFVQKMKRRPSYFNNIINSDVIVISLFKHFYESGKFEKLMRNFSVIKKPIFVIKYEDFKIDEMAVQKKLFRGVYDLYKHKNHRYQGYELRRLFSDVEDEGLALTIEKFVYDIKYDIYLSDSFECNKSSHVALVLDALLKENKFKVEAKYKFKDSKDREDESSDAVEKSKVVLFFLKNDYMKSDEFLNEYQNACYFKKKMIFILFEPIDGNVDDDEEKINFNNLNVIHLYKTAQMDQAASLIKSEQFNRLLYFICLLLKEESGVEFAENMISLRNIYVHRKRFTKNKRPVYTQRPSIVHSVKAWKTISSGKANLDVLLDMPQNNHILAFNNKFVLVFDRDTLKFLKKEPLQDMNKSIHDACYIEKLKKIALLEVHRFVLLNADNYQISERRILSTPEHDSLHQRFIQYNEKNQMIYVFDAFFNITRVYECPTFKLNNEVIINYGIKSDKHVESENAVGETQHVNSMKIRDGRVFYLYRDCVHVYNESLEFIAKFGDFIRSFNYQLMVGAGARLRDCLLVASKQSLCVFGASNYKLYDQIQIKEKEKYDDVMLANDHLIRYGKGGLKAYKFYFVDRDTLKRDFTRDEFVCKIDAHRPHLLVNAHVLPCEHLGCLECIYRNFDLNTNKYECRLCVESTSEHHVLDDEMKKASVIEDNLKVICEDIVQYFKKLAENSENKNDKLDCLNNYFDMLDNNIDIRLESLIADIERYESKLLITVNKTEKKLKAKLRRSSETTNKDNLTLAPNKDNLLALFKHYPFRSVNSIACTSIGRFIR